MLRFIKLIIILVLSSQLVHGQKEVNSPYARFGVGLLEQQGTFRSLGMGGTGIALRDPQNLFYQNPASFSSIDTNSFVLDFAMDYRIIGLDNGEESYSSDDMNLHHIIIAFPLSRKIGFATGITPFSTGYYNMNSITSIGDPGYDPIIGEIEETHNGAGGFSKYFVGLGIDLFKGFSAGASMNFIFGEIFRENHLYFLEDNNYFNNTYREKINLRGLNFDIGAQYHFNIGESYFGSLGFKYTNQGDLRAETEELLARGSVYTGSTYSIDTISYSPLSSTTVTFPSALGLGVAFGIENKLTLAADYTFSDWSKSSFLGYEEYYTSSKSINVGLSYIPDKFANYNILNRVEYRLGGRMSDSHLVVNGEQLKEFGITFGAGIPLRRSKSNINVFFEYGSRKGSLELGLHNETCYSMGLSFNFYDYWFIKRKYD